MKHVLLFRQMVVVKQEIQLVRSMVTHLYIDVNKASINTFLVHSLDHVDALCLVVHQEGIILVYIDMVLILRGTN